MIDPTVITKFDRTESELEELLLFAVAVAGKTAKIIAQKIEDFLLLERGDASPFEKIRRMKKHYSLMLNMKRVKLGRYSTLDPCFSQLSKSGIDLKSCSLEELEKFPGIGPKTSRFFVLHSRPNQKIAALDVHILSYLRDLGHDTPNSTPTGKRYTELERIFFEHADAMGQDVATLDLAIWNKYSKRSGLGSTVESVLRTDA